MRMIFLLGIMLVSLPTAPSLFTYEDTESDVSRSQILKAILEQSQEFFDISKRMAATVDVPARMECCPSETHLIHPRGGISRDGKLLEIYRDHRTVQKFYQTACKADVQDEPCHLIKRKYQPASRCAQRFSYVYAFVRDFNVSESFRLDYIRVKSGCSCELDVTLHEEIELR
ncbi:unnamed protein product [Lymnaea stagnalis]|uniref:Spaetzle domain-containing protein n=1 Tax=Lymnaea stagnalis TaxID=6523 RepID=A0AAV2GZG8_LYMST